MNLEKFAVEIYELNRFFAIFPQKIQLDTGKRLEMTWNMYHFHRVSNAFPTRYSGEVKTNTVELYR